LQAKESLGRLDDGPLIREMLGQGCLRPQLCWTLCCCSMEAEASHPVAVLLVHSFNDDEDATATQIFDSEDVIVSRNRMLFSTLESPRHHYIE
jgi:hypothetical protein